MEIITRIPGPQPHYLGEESSWWVCDHTAADGVNETNENINTNTKTNTKTKTKTASIGEIWGQPVMI